MTKWAFSPLKSVSFIKVMKFSKISVPIYIIGINKGDHIKLSGTLLWIFHLNNKYQHH